MRKITPVNKRRDCSYGLFSLNWKKIGKTSAVFLISAVAAGAFYYYFTLPERHISQLLKSSRVFFHLNKNAFSQDIRSAIIPTPITQFPKYFERIFHPGLLVDITGKVQCPFSEESFIPPGSCDKIGRAVSEHLMPRISRYFSDNCRLAFIEKGCRITIGSKAITVGNNPQKLTNYKNALGFIEKKVLNSSFFKNSSHVVETLKKTHQLLVDKLPQNGGGMIQGGVFRDKNIFVDKYEAGDLFEELIHQGASQEELKLIQETALKIRTYGMEYVKKLSPKAKRIWDRIVYFPPTWKKLPQLAKSFGDLFYKKIQGVIQRTKDPIDVAAWTHQKIVKAHFFCDGNGRLARLWQNIVLQLGGIKGVIFPSEEKYTLAVESYKSYREFLERLIRWNRSIQL